MVRLRSSFASVWVLALLLITALAAPPASAQEPNWLVIDAPNGGGGGGPVINSEGEAPPAGSAPEHLYILHGQAGIGESPLPDTIKDDLLMVQQDPGGIMGPGRPTVLEEELEETVYIIGQEIAEGIEASELAGELTPEIEAIAEPLDEEEVSYSASGPTTASLFGGNCASQEKTINKVINLSDLDDWSPDEPFDLGGGVTGTYNINGHLQGQVTAQIKFEVKRKKVIAWCVPYGAKFKNARAFGNATSDGGVTVTGTVNYQDSFGPWPIAKPELFKVVFFVGPIPVVIGFNLPIEAGLDLSATVAASINYNGRHKATGSFDYTCTLNDCFGSSNFDNTVIDGSDQSFTGGVDGRVKPTPWADIGFRAYLYTELIAYAQVGVRPHLLGDLWGFTGNNCGDGDGNGNTETVRALTFDLDYRIDLTGQASVLGRDPWKKTLKTGSVSHIHFWDLLGSSALEPQLHGPALLEMKDPGEYKVRMRSCWPYTDKVTYKLNWDDGSAVQELQGVPTTEVTASHTWNTSGNKSVTATSWKDEHGRDLNQTTTRTIEVKQPVPLTLTVTPSPMSSTAGNLINWTATATGGHAATRQYAFFRRPAGASAWIPAVTAPNWQTSNALSWNPALSDTGTWEIIVWVKDRNTEPTDNTYGFSAYANAGPVLVVAPLGISCPAPVNQTVTQGTNPVTWNVSSTGGTPGTIQYTMSRNPVGTTNYAPLSWQSGNLLSWTPAAAELGTWQVSALVKDVNTPATPGYAAYCNLGQITVVGPLSLSVTASPVSAPAGTAINWTATANGGIPASTKYALFRRRSGTTPWTPDVTAPVWQTSNILSWTPAPGDTGAWDIIVWVKDGNTPASANTYGYAAYANAGSVQVVAPLAVTVTASPAYSIYGNTITWTATATGGDTPTIQYTLGRRLVGSSTWIPSPLVWQSGNVLSWTPTSADIGTWEIAVGVRDRNTAPDANGLGYSAAAVASNVQVVAPLSLTVTASPATSVHGTPITWTATASGGVPATTRFAFFRRRSGTTPWTPDVTSPAWQTGNTFTWTPSSADVGSWDVYVWVKDSLTPANMNTYGYAAGANAGGVQVTTPPLTLSVTPSPASTYHGFPITWTATAGGGTPATTKYALFRRRAGTTPWIPDVTAPAWQSGNVMSWTPGSADVGTWEIILWIKDGNTPANANTYGFAAYSNPGPVQVVAPPTLSVTPSPALVNYGTPITWTASATSSNPSTLRYAFFRRRSGTTTWSPSVNSPSWQTSNTYSWTPGSADAGTWDTYVWVKDGITPPSMNTYGYAAGFNTGGVRVVAPLTSMSCAGNPGSAYSGTTFNWTANANGGDAVTLQYALLRRRSGTSTWIPAQTSPSWQSGNAFSWTPGSSDTGTWEIMLWARDGNTPANMNTYGYGAACAPGNIQVLVPLTVTSTGSPATSPYGATITWTATASGGTPATTKYAFFRRPAGATNWMPDVTAPSWQTSNTYTWTPTAADVGSWGIIVWVKDGNTPASMNTYGFAAYHNPGAVEVTTPAPLTVTGTGSPSTSPAGTTITWTATASGGIPSTVKYALFRRKAGTSNWIPDVTAPSWQTSRYLTWTPSAADVGTWEIIVWVKDINTTPTQNGYGFAAYYNAQPVQVY